MARQHGPRCIEVAAELLEDPDPRIRLAALVALLDRGFGRPAPTATGTTASMPTILQLMHHEAAVAFSNELLAEREAAERQLREPRVINGEATKLQGSTPINLFEPALE
jgi:HEAT repeat protein